MATIQVVSITDLDQLSELGDNDYLLVYDLSESTWKRIEKNNIQLDIAAHDNSMHTTTFLVASSNLSDLTNPGDARTNLGLDNTLNRNNNLADLTDPGDARANLGLDATLNRNNDLADLNSVENAKGNLGLDNLNIRTQGNYEILDADATLEIGKKYIIKENVIATLPTTASVGNEIEIVCGESFGDTDVLDSTIDPNGLNFEGDTATLQMTTESFRIVYTGSDYGWSRI